MPTTGSGTMVAAMTEFSRGFRRRWPTGVAIVTTTAPEATWRGVTVGSLMLLSLEPPTLALGLATESSFHELLTPGRPFAVTILDRSGEFLADRFAGRAPVPDARFNGIPHTMQEITGEAIPVVSGTAALAWAGCRVLSNAANGDHALILGEIVCGDLAPDTDDPLLFYEGHYRGLEVR